MKLLYITAINEKSVGIRKKINMQINYLKSQQIDVTELDINRNGKNRVIDGILRRLPYTSIHKWSIDANNLIDTDCFYIRYAKCDYQFIKNIKKAKKINPKMKIIVEIPTYPYDNEAKFKIQHAMIQMKDRWNRRKMDKYVNRILTFSDDEKIFNILTIRVSNAVNTASIVPRKVVHSSESINIIAVANFGFWHGYDRFINGMDHYYKHTNESNKVNIVLHLVGEGNELLKYRTLVSKYNLSDHVLFYGMQEKKDLDKIYDRCEIGLDALGRHRSNIYYNSTLKGKEYGAKGLPIISGVKTELDNHQAFKYYIRVPADDSPVKMEEIIDFYNHIYNKNESKETVNTNIRSYTETNFDVSVVWQQVVDYLKDNQTLKDS